MPNKFKYNKTGSEANSIFKGNWAIDNTPANTGGGPSSSTSFFHGHNIPAGGYVIYSPNGVFVANNDTELIGRINGLGGNVASASAALTWAAGQANHIVLNKPIDNIPTSGLVLNSDVSNLSGFVNSEPTVNRVTNWDLDTGWSKDYQTNIVFNEIPPPTGISAPTVGFNKGPYGSEYWYSYGNFTPQIPGATYVVSMYVLTYDPGFSINYYTADNSEAGRVWGPHIAVPNDRRWHRIIWPAFVNPVGSQSDSLSFNFNMTGATGSPSQRTYFCAPQMELGTVATPFVGGTRAQNTTIYDLSGNNNIGTLTNGPTFNSNKSIDFDGVDDYVNIPHSSSIAPSTGYISVEAIFKATSAGSHNGSIIYNKENEYEMSAGGGFISYAFRPNWAWVGSTPFNINQWYHTMVTYDQQYQRLYVNGVEVYSAALSGAVGNLYTEALRIGARGGNGSAFGFFNGSIPLVKVYNRALSTSEVLQNYYGGAIVTSGLVAHYDAASLISYGIEGSATWKDMSGNNHDLTLINGPVWNSKGYFDNDADSYFTGPGSSAIPTGNSPYTMIVWARQTGEWGASNGFISIGGYGTNNQSNALRTLSNSVGQFHHYWWFTDLSLTNNNAGLALDKWFMVAASFDGTTRKIWVNGVTRAADTPGGLHNVTSSTIQLSKTVSTEYQVGDIAGASIYNRALTEDEMLQNFNAQRNRFGI
jgi:hypothetical protein